MDAYIKAISYYLPEKIVTNEILSEEFPEWSAEKIASKVGVQERHISDENETALDMAERAVKMMLEEHNIEKNDIDYLLLCSQSVDYYLPSSSCILQNRLGLKTSCGAFDYNLGCSGFVYGLSVAKGLIAGGIANNVLLVTSETYNKHIHPKDKGNRTIFGDAAAATLISTNGIAKIGNFSLGTDGSGAKNLIVKTGGQRHKEPLNDLRFDEADNPISSDYLFMDGKAIFDFTAAAVPTMVNDALTKNNLHDNQIDLFVFHQANKFMINYLRKLLEIDKERFYIFLENVGNTVSSTIPIALYEAKKENRLNGNVLIAGFGVGYSYGATILNCND